MKKLLFLFIAFPFVVSAQDSYSVTYKRPGSILKIPFMPEQKLGPLIERLVFNDSMSFNYSYRLPSKDPGESLHVFVTPIGKCTFYNANEGITYVPRPITTGKKSLRGMYLVTIPDTIPVKPPWITTEELRIILGYKCFPALNVDGNNDSTLVWYTTEIPLPFGPAGFTGFPGLVLEVQSQKYGYTNVVEKIEKKPLLIKLPQGEFVTRDEFSAIWKKLYY